MANYNADISIRVVAEKAKQQIDSIFKSLEKLTKSAVKVSVKPLEGELRKVDTLARQIGQSIQGIGARGGLGLAAIAAANLGTQIQGMLGPVGQLANAVSGIPDLWGMVAVAAMAFAPQITRATKDTLKLGQASVQAIKGKLNADLKEATDRINEVSKATQNTAQVIDKLVKGASLSKLNRLVSDSRAEMEGFWHQTRGAEQAATKLALAIKAQRQEQEKLNSLVIRANVRLGIPNEENVKALEKFKKETIKSNKLALQQQKAETLETAKRIAMEERDRIQEERANARRLRHAIRLRKLEERRAAAAKMSRMGENMMLGVGFPMLFGGGGGAVAGGALGAGLQGMMGTKGGFGAQILLSAVGQRIDEFIGKTVELGQAFNALKPDIDALIASMGISGTALEQQMKDYAEVATKEEALAMASKEMSRVIGKDGVAALKEFGESATEWGNDFDRAMLKVRAAVASFVNWAQNLPFFGGGKDKVDKGLRSRTNQSLFGGEDSVMKGIQNEILAIQNDRDLSFYSGRGLRWNDPQSESNKTELIEMFKKLADARQKVIDKGEEEDRIEATINKRIEKRLENINKEVEKLDLILKYGEEEGAIQAEISEIVQKVLKEEESITEEQRKQIENAVRKRKDKQDELDAVRELNELYNSIEQTIKDGIVDGIYEAIKGTKTLGEVASRVLDQIAKKIIESQVDKMFSSFGAGASPGAGAAAGATQQKSNWLSKIPLLGLFSGGRARRAAGGPVTGGSSYLVGEKGPELFVPGSSGNIVPNNAMGGMVINVDASGSSVEGDADKSRELGQLIGAAVQAEIGRQQRPGGMLY